MATMCHKKTLDYVNTGFECFDIASTKAHKKSSRHFGQYVKLRKRLLILEVCRFKIVDWYICLYKRTVRQRIMFRGVSVRRRYDLFASGMGVFMTGASGSAFDTSTDDIHGASVIVDALMGHYIIMRKQGVLIL